MSAGSVLVLVVGKYKSEQDCFWWFIRNMMMLKELNTEECVFLFIINQVLTLHLHLHTSITIYPQVIYVFTYLITSNLLFCICSGKCWYLQEHCISASWSKCDSVTTLLTIFLPLTLPPYSLLILQHVTHLLSPLWTKNNLHLDPFC